MASKSMTKTDSATAKPKGLSPEKLRAIIGGSAFGVMFTAQMLSSKDPDGDGVDDYFAKRLQQIAFDMQSFALTGKLPTDSE